VDSGIYLEHPDLASQLWTNPGEIPGNGSDDDLNGKIDDVNGWHFFQSWTPDGYIPAENAIVTDEYGHGTHVAGIAAAATNNDAALRASWGGADAGQALMSTGWLVSDIAPVSWPWTTADYQPEPGWSVAVRPRGNGVCS
jgi:subtilisin family serine protease